MQICLGVNPNSGSFRVGRAWAVGGVGWVGWGGVGRVGSGIMLKDESTRFLRRGWKSIRSSAGLFGMLEEHGAFRTRWRTPGNMDLVAGFACFCALFFIHFCAQFFVTVRNLIAVQVTSSFVIFTMLTVLI